MAEPAPEGTGDPTEVSVVVRYFAAARAAAGAELESVTVRPGATLADLVDGLARRGPRLSSVLSRCSFLCDGVAVGSDAASVRALKIGQTIDVLPPFAGG